MGHEVRAARLRALHSSILNARKALMKIDHLTCDELNGLQVYGGDELADAVENLKKYVPELVRQIRDLDNPSTQASVDIFIIERKKP